MRLQQRTPRAADLGWCRAAGLAHPLHQLNGRRRADREATGRLPDRTTPFDGPHEPLTEVLGQGSGHNEPRCSRPQLPGIRTSDSMQLQTALAEKKSEPLWVWKAWDRASGQLVDWECG